MGIRIWKFMEKMITFLEAKKKGKFQPIIKLFPIIPIQSKRLKRPTSFLIKAIHKTAYHLPHSLSGLSTAVPRTSFGFHLSIPPSFLYPSTHPHPNIHQNENLDLVYSIFFPMILPLVKIFFGTICSVFPMFNVFVLLLFREKEPPRIVKCLFYKWNDLVD